MKTKKVAKKVESKTAKPVKAEPEVKAPKKESKQTQEAKKQTMTIFEAKKRSQELSKKYPDKKLYAIVNEKTGDCGVSFNAEIDGYETHYCYKNGSEIALEVANYKKGQNKIPKGVKVPVTTEENENQLNKNQLNNLNNKNMKNLKKESTKKSVPATAKKSAPAKLPKGKKQTMTIKQILPLLKAGKRVILVNSGKAMLYKIASKKNPALEREVVIEG